MEDWTHHGLSDLQERTIRTPLAPYETFLDDPLRVMRTIRFASRLQFHVAKHLFDALDSEVKKALATKISRERIGQELEKTLSCARPDLAMHYINELDIFSIVFKLPPTLLLPETLNWDNKQVLSNIRNLLRVLDATNTISLSADRRRILLYAVIMKDLTGFQYLTAKKKKESASIFVMMESLKLSKNHSVDVEIILESWKQLHGHLVDLSRDANTKLSRLELGKLMRHCGELWQEALFLANLELLSGLGPFEVERADSPCELLNV